MICDSIPNESPTARLLCSYEPLIRTDKIQTILILFEETLLKEMSFRAEIRGVHSKEIVPLTGYPKELSSSPALMKGFFKQAFFIAVKDPTTDRYQHVEARLGLKGGGLGIGEQDVLPMYPGYAMGHLIRKGDFLAPIYRRKLLSIKTRIDLLEAEKKENLADTSDESDKAKLIAIYTANTTKLNNEKKAILKNLEEIEKEKSDSLVDTVLPIDQKRTYPQYVPNAHSFSEESSRILITKPAKGNIEKEVRAQIDSFINKDLGVPGESSAYLPRKTLDDFAKRITHMLDQSSSVILIGSFITLSRIKRLDPIVLRESAISADLIANAHKYYVLAEAVLGGLFLGFGEEHRFQSTLAPATSTPASPSVGQSAAQGAMIRNVSFVAQGALANLTAEDQDLWSIYVSWRKHLMEGEHTGYPIGFKVRELAEVLRENDIQVPPTQPYPPRT